MACKLRVQYPGATYHVMSRGDRREPVFLDDSGCRAFPTSAPLYLRKPAGDPAERAWCGGASAAQAGVAPRARPAAQWGVSIGKGLLIMIAENISETPS
jgi:hypothetical protein